MLIVWVEQYIPHLTAKEIEAMEQEWGEELHTKKTIDQIKELVFKIIHDQNIKVILLSLVSIKSREYVYDWIINLSMS